MAGCGFEHGARPTDQPIDAMVDGDLSVKWAVDPTSKKGVPASSYEWADLITTRQLTFGVPSHVWLMQETSGSLTDSIGSLSLNPINAPTYRNPVSGWSRVGVGTVDTTINQGFVSYATGNLDGSSYLILAYVAVTSLPSSERSLFGIGEASDHRYVGVSSTGFARANGLGSASPVTGTHALGTTIHPVVLLIDASAMRYVVYTDEEKLAPTWSTTSSRGPLLVVGNGAPGAGSVRYLYAAEWTGGTAQVSDAQVKALLTSLGWTVTGY
jgi:hypothetical protein